jgi:hypothetical protein
VTTSAAAYVQQIFKTAFRRGKGDIRAPVFERTNRIWVSDSWSEPDTRCYTMYIFIIPVWHSLLSLYQKGEFVQYGGEQEGVRG